jgi:hypothetical protein
MSDPDLTLAADAYAAKTQLIKNGWTQDCYQDRETGAVCLVGAIRLAVHGEVYIDGGTEIALAQARRHWWLSKAIQQTAGTDYIPGWNDAPGRAVDEVIAVLDKIIESCLDHVAKQGATQADHELAGGPTP